MSAKARSLRERMSIDPDAPEPVARPRRQRPAAPTDSAPEHREPESAATSTGTPPAVPEASSPEPSSPEPSSPEPSSPEPSSPEPSSPQPETAVTEPTGESATSPGESPEIRSATAQATPAGAPAPLAAVTSPATDTPTSTARSTPPSRSSKRSTRRKGRDDPGWTSALDDPSVSSGGNGYRSFYVSHEVFARFRAAIYWTARRPDATDVPDNMSAGIEDFMDQVASDLERRFNGKDVFPPTPDQLKAHRRRESGGTPG